MKEIKNYNKDRVEEFKERIANYNGKRIANYNGSLTKEEEQMVNQYFENLKQNNNQYIKKLKKATKNSYTYYDLKNKIKKIKY